MKILVTGGHGFLGSHLVHRLRAAGHEVIAPHRWEYGLTLQGHADKMLKDHHPEVVYHLAARVGGIGANQAAPAVFLRDNAVMGLNVLEACACARPMPKLIMVGTTCAYPCHCPIPFREDDLWNGYPEPTNAPYGVAKRMLLVAAQAYREQYGLNAVTLIPTNLYGPGDNFDPATSHVIPAMIRKVSEAVEEGRREVVLWGDGTPTRDFLHVGDCAAALVRAGEVYNSPEPINLGSGREVSMRELAAIVARAVGYAGAFAWDSSRPNGQPRRCLDTTRAKELLGWEARITLENGINDLLTVY